MSRRNNMQMNLSDAIIINIVLTRTLRVNVWVFPISIAAVVETM